MEPRPPKRPRPSSLPPGTAARPWDAPDATAGAARTTAMPVYDSGIYRPPVETSEPVGNVDFQVAPRSQRGHRWLGPLIAALLLAAVVGGAAFAVTKFMQGEDKRDDTAIVVPTSQPTATQQAGAPTEQPTATTAAASETEQPAQPTATTAAQPKPTSTTAPAEPTTASSQSQSATGAARYIPDAETVGLGFAATSDSGDRTADEVAAQIAADPAEGAALLEQWGWQENVFQTYEIPADLVDPNATKFVNVSVHRFDSEEGAAEAMQYLPDYVVSVQPTLQEVEAPQVGDQSRALYSPGDPANPVLYVVYVRDGKYVIRIGGASDTGDPKPDVDALAQALVG